MSWHVGKKLILLTAILAAVGCQQSSESASAALPEPSSQQISTTSDYPGVVLIVAPQGRGICTGTFISERAILTAAHCTKRAGTYTVVTAWANYTSSTVEALGPGVVDDPNDIAILILDEDAASRNLGQIHDIHDSVKPGDVVRLVGYGCNDINTRTGSGTKRTGTNTVAQLDDYVVFHTPLESATASASRAGIRGILGPENRAGSCFGDSGGPALLDVNGELKIVAVTHAGGSTSSLQISEYVDMANRSDNRNFIAQVNSTYSLGIRGF